MSDIEQYKKQIEAIENELRLIMTHYKLNWEQTISLARSQGIHPRDVNIDVPVGQAPTDVIVKIINLINELNLIDIQIKRK